MSDEISFGLKLYVVVGRGRVDPGRDVFTRKCDAIGEAESRNAEGFSGCDWWEVVPMRRDNGVGRQWCW